MSVFSIHAPSRSSTGASRGGVRRAIAGLATRLSTEWQAWQATRAMQALDDTALHDMGLTAGEIAHAVRHGRSRGSR